MEERPGDRRERARYYHHLCKAHGGWLCKGHDRNVLGRMGQDDGGCLESIRRAEGPDPFPSSGSIAWKSFWTFTEGVTLEAGVWNIIRRLRGQIIFRAAEVSLGTRSGPSLGEADGNMAGACSGDVSYEYVPGPSG